MEEEDSILSKTLHVVTLLTANLSVISFDKPIRCNFLDDILLQSF